MANDVHYFIVFTTIFLLLGIVAPLLKAELIANGVDVGEDELTGQDVNSLVPEEKDYNAITIISIVLNFLTFAFWTFGLPVWLNIILLFFRIPLFFLLGRNLMLSGG